MKIFFIYFYLRIRTKKTRAFFRASVPLTWIRRLLCHSNNLCSLFFLLLLNPNQNCCDYRWGSCSPCGVSRLPVAPPQLVRESCRLPPPGSGTPSAIAPLPSVDQWRAVSTRQSPCQTDAVVCRTARWKLEPSHKRTQWKTILEMIDDCQNCQTVKFSLYRFTCIEDRLIERTLCEKTQDMLIGLYHLTGSDGQNLEWRQNTLSWWFRWVYIDYKIAKRYHRQSSTPSLRNLRR